ncbi:MAG TPA: endolytic transglycosylase MltG [Cytophagales bacterium]|nr:endolytic transglycosylase MltG [Cytophagales bacterium]
MISRNKKIGILVFCATVVITFTFYFYQLFFGNNILVGSEKDDYLLIPTGANFETVVDSLKKNDFLHDELSFRFVSKILKYDKNVKPGRYLLTQNANNFATIMYIRSGRQEPVKLTFHNIRLKPDLAGRITKNIEPDSARFLSLIQNPAYVNKYGFDTTTIMCMFLPDTYEVYWTITADELIDRLHDEYKKFWNEERTAKAQELGLTRTQVSILASIVQAETSRSDEKARIAGLYINRLKNNMPLQADPTIVYANGKFDLRRILKVHMEVDSPYNTYKYKGLPPGPINLPNLSSIDAVLNYENHDFIYMCAKEDFSGYHNFASNFRDHLRNARIYQKALNKANIK